MFIFRFLISVALQAAAFLLFCISISGTGYASTPLDPKAPDMTTVDAAFTHGDVNYFFYSEWYYAYRHGASTPIKGYPKKIKGSWPGFPKAFQKDIDAVFQASKKHVTFFKGDEYMVYDMDKWQVHPGYPKKIKGHWEGLWEKDIDAVVVWPGNHKAYFFKGPDVKAFNLKTYKTEYTLKIPRSWKGVWKDGVDAALKWDGKKSYLFNGQQYIRYNNDRDRAEHGYPKDIEKEWHFVKGEAYKTAIKRKKGPACGGIGKAACGFEKATYIDKAKGTCPSGSFWDPIDGGSCYKCPSNYNRTVLWSVKSDKACMRGPRENLVKAHRKRQASWPWSCNKGEFWDLYDGGACWTCPKGYYRTAYHVASKKACTKWQGSTFAKSTYKGGLPCPKNSFLDIGRLECWSCPQDYSRTIIAAVDQPKACLADNKCAPGNVAVGNPISGYTCYKEGVCGKKGQRPCLITESFPSCNSGLAEDFIANKCVDSKIAACLTGVRSLRYGMLAAKGLSKVEEEAMKVAQSAMDELAKDIPGLGSALKAADHEIRKIAEDAERLMLKEVESVIPGADETLSNIEDVLQDIGDTFLKNHKKLVHLLSQDEFCTLSKSDRHKEITRLIGADLKKIQLAAAKDGLWQKLEGVFGIKSAHASIKRPSQIILGVNLIEQANHIKGGLTIAFGFFPTFTDHVTLYMGAPIGITTDAKPSTKVTPYIKLIPSAPYNLGKVTTMTIGGAVNLGSASFKRRGKVSMNVGVSALVNWTNKDKPITYGGLVLYPWRGQKKDTRTFAIDGVTKTLDFSIQQVVPVVKF